MSPSVPAERVNPFQKFGLLFVMPYLFVMYSRLFDIKLSQLHIPAIATGLTLLFILVGGGFISAFSTTAGRLLLAFTVWMAICVPFSIWPRLSYGLVTDSWPRTMIAFLALGGLVFTFQEFRRVVYALAWGISALALLSLKYGEMQDGRLFLPQGRFSNPNDLAQVLLMGLPFLLYVILTGNVFMRCVAALCTLPIFYCLLRTGSRGGFLGFLLIALFIFLRAPVSGKMMVAIGSAVIIIAGAVILPPNLRQRYVTLFSVEKNDSAGLALNNDDEGGSDHLQAMAASSAQSREQLLKDSIRLTFTHPLFGVGPAMFPTAEERLQAARGIHAPSLGSHNSYTQISSETGFVGFFLYYAAFVYCLKRCTAVARFANTRLHPNWKEISRMAFCLKISLLSYAITSFFSHVAYHSFFTTLVGLMVAMERAVQPQFAAWLQSNRVRSAAAPAAVPSGAPLLPAYVQREASI